MFQNQVYSENSLGREGFIARNNPVVSIPMIAEGSDVVVGKFVFDGTNPEKQVVGASAGTSRATEVAGLAIYQGAQVNFGAESLVLNEGEEVRVMKKGYAYVRATTQAVKGQSVYMDPTTGEIQTASSAPESFIDTGWKVEKGAVANQVCEIYNI